MFVCGRPGRPAAVPVAVLSIVFSAAACGPSSTSEATNDVTSESTTTTTATGADRPPTPGGYNFDRSDPEGGVANIMEAFATDRTTAECIFEAWGDVANVAPEDLTVELMTFPICGTSIFQMITGDPRFTGRDGG